MFANNVLIYEPTHSASKCAMHASYIKYRLKVKYPLRFIVSYISLLRSNANSKALVIRVAVKNTDDFH